MDAAKEKIIRVLVDSVISGFSEGFRSRYKGEKNNPKGVINSKKHNCFIAELGEEFVFYSALVRSFDSSFGNVLEKLGNSIAKVSYDVRGNISSFILPSQTQYISELLSNYENHSIPEIKHYSSLEPIIPKNIESFKRTHCTDNYFYNPEKNEHYLIELKAGGDLDNKKSRAEKNALLEEYYLLKNKISADSDLAGGKVFIYFATAYNKDGEGNKWNQERVRQYFAEDELLIGKDYWNFVCGDENGFEIVFDQYKISCEMIRKALKEIKQLYFPGERQ